MALKICFWLIAVDKMTYSIIWQHAECSTDKAVTDEIKKQGQEIRDQHTLSLITDQTIDLPVPKVSASLVNLPVVGIEEQLAGLIWNKVLFRDFTIPLALVMARYLFFVCLFSSSCVGTNLGTWYAVRHPQTREEPPASPSLMYCNLFIFVLLMSSCWCCWCSSCWCWCDAISLSLYF